MTMGRPALYTSSEEMQAIIDAYFAERLAEGKPVTISGLAYALEMTTESLRNYGTKDDFSATVKRAKQRVEMALEDRLDAASPTGAIFNLKNNFGWKDQQDHTVSAPGGGAVRWQVVGVEPDAE
jgi:hypothetical protein